MLKQNTTLLLFLFTALVLKAQNSEVGTLINDDLKMNFPGIYFKHNSTEYAKMPYPADSCFKYIVKSIKDISDYAIWRDSLETEELTKQRIKKIQNDLRKFGLKDRIDIENMREVQKISGHTIKMSKDKAQTEYLLSLNSAFEIATLHLSYENKQLNHILHPRIWCGKCWINLFHIDKRSRDTRKMYRRIKEKQKERERKK